MVKKKMKKKCQNYKNQSKSKRKMYEDRIKSRVFVSKMG